VVCPSMPSPPSWSLSNRRFCSGGSRGGRRSEISLWKKQGKVGELYWQDAKPSGASSPTHYSTTVNTCHSIVHRAPFRAQNHPKPRVAFQLRGKEKRQG
jgi:hypothetical protein